MVANEYVPLREQHRIPGWSNLRDSQSKDREIGGNGFYEKGTTVGWFQSNPGRESKTDYCQNETNLVEYTCVDDYYVWDIIRRCANGCSEGACIE